MTGTEQGEPSAALFYLEFPGLSSVAFREISGVRSERDVIVEHQLNEQGKATYVKVPCELSWSNVVLKKGIDTDMSLWAWRNAIITGGIDGQKKDGQIYILDAQGNQRTTWKIVAAWPCSYVVGGMVPATNEMLLKEIQLAHQGLERIA